MTKKKFNQIKRLYDSAPFFTANGLHKTFEAITGIKVSEADYAKIRRFEFAADGIAFCESQEKRKTC